MKQPTVECVLDIRAGLGECPIWCDRSHTLFWTDIDVGRLNQFDPATGKNRVWELGEPLGSFALWEDGAILAGLKSGLHRYSLETGEKKLLAAPEKHLPQNRLNDGRCDPAGRFWVGSMHDIPSDRRKPIAALYRYDGARGCVRMVEAISVSNGLAFSPDGRTMYHADAQASVRTIWAYDFDPAEGAISNKRVFVDTHGMPGRPDGAAVDSEGCYWMAAVDGWELVRFTPAGKVDRRIALPVAKPTMLAFGGSRLDTIYVTSIRPKGDLSEQPQAGSIFAVNPGVTGLPEPRFAG